MIRNQPVAGVFLFTLFILFAMAGSNTARAEDSGASPGSAAQAPLTRADVVKIVHAEIQKAFDLRSWHKYAAYVGRYTGPEASALFTLTGLDRGTAVGNADSGVRVIAYEDYECPFCKRFELTSVPELKRKFQSSVLFVYRFYPLPMHGEAARKEAIAGACVAKAAGPDAFWRYTQSVFVKTGTNGKGTKTPLHTIANTALRNGQGENASGESYKQYRQCAQGKQGKSLIGPSSSFPGVNGTPTVFIVDTHQNRAWRLTGALPSWVFSAVITNVLNGQPGNSDWAITQHKVAVPD